VICDVILGICRCLKIRENPEFRAYVSGFPQAPRGADVAREKRMAPSAPLTVCDGVI
jgi:hypothetical protein